MRDRPDRDAAPQLLVELGLRDVRDSSGQHASVQASTQEEASLHCSEPGSRQRVKPKHPHEPCATNNLPKTTQHREDVPRTFGKETPRPVNSCHQQSAPVVAWTEQNSFQIFGTPKARRYPISRKMRKDESDVEHERVGPARHWKTTAKRNQK